VQAGAQVDARGTVQRLAREARSSGRVSESPTGTAEYAIVSPILTESACTRCHGDRARLGFISAVVSTVGEENRIRGIRNHLLGGGMALLAITCAAVYLTINRWVTRPIIGLTRAVDDMQTNASDGQPSLEPKDEIARLTGSFNSMKASIADKTEALLKTERDLAHSQRLASIGLLAAGVAHEIGSSLSAIQLQAGFWEERTDGPVQAAAASVSSAALRIAQLRRELLTFDRRQTLQFTECDLRVLVQECLSLIESSRLRCNLRAPNDPVLVSVDRDLLARALGNVLSNAAQAMTGDGTVTVAVGKTEGARAEVTVRDTGPGILPEDVDRVFEPFFTNERTGQGSGLGLTIARDIIVRHHGEISAERTPQGACFRILLPLKGPGRTDANHLDC
jgi:two-component system NtrC family sensor kinase